MRPGFSGARDCYDVARLFRYTAIGHTSREPEASLRRCGRPMRRPTRNSRPGSSRGGARQRGREAHRRAGPAASSRAIRAKAGGLGGIEDFLHDYSLSTKEGLALMVLAEALLRVPDAATADRLIEDKLAAGDLARAARSTRPPFWSRPRPGRSASPPASSAGARRRRRILDEHRERLGRPAVRTATRQAMRLLGSHFVLGQTIEEALGAGARASRNSATRSTCSARARAPRPDAERYFDAYADAIAAIGASAGKRRCRSGPASRSSSRRCIRATRRSRASA